MEKEKKQKKQHLAIKAKLCVLNVLLKIIILGFSLGFFSPTNLALIDHPPTFKELE